MRHIPTPIDRERIKVRLLSKRYMIEPMTDTYHTSIMIRHEWEGLYALRMLASATRRRRRS